MLEAKLLQLGACFRERASVLDDARGSELNRRGRGTNVSPLTLSLRAGRRECDQCIREQNKSLEISESESQWDRAGTGHPL